jgi:hypothetical protein
MQGTLKGWHYNNAMLSKKKRKKEKERYPPRWDSNPDFGWWQ